MSFSKFDSGALLYDTKTKLIDFATLACESGKEDDLYFFSLDAGRLMAIKAEDKPEDPEPGDGRVRPMQLEKPKDYFIVNDMTGEKKKIREDTEKVKLYFFVSVNGGGILTGALEEKDPLTMTAPMLLFAFDQQGQTIWSITTPFSAVLNFARAANGDIFIVGAKHTLINDGFALWVARIRP